MQRPKLSLFTWARQKENICSQLYESLMELCEAPLHKSSVTLHPPVLKEATSVLLFENMDQNALMQQESYIPSPQ